MIRLDDPPTKSGFKLMKRWLLTPAREGQQANAAGARGRPGAAEIRTVLENAWQNQKK
jgi:hypothetical protein